MAVALQFTVGATLERNHGGTSKMWQKCDLEFIVIKVEDPVRALIATIYRPPNYRLDKFLPQMEHLLDSLDMMNLQPVIICGDFNEDLISTGKKPIQELLQIRGYTQMITTATTEKKWINWPYLNFPTKFLPPAKCTAHILQLSQSSLLYTEQYWLLIGYLFIYLFILAQCKGAHQYWPFVFCQL